MIGECSYEKCGVAGNLAAVVFHPHEVLACDEHYHDLSQQYLYRKRPRNANLGQTVEKWTDVSKKGVVRNHRITTGKQWEIEHRTIAEDGKTVINSATGKEAQY